MSPSYSPFPLIAAVLAQIRLSFALPGPAAPPATNHLATRSIDDPFALEALPSISLAPAGSIITAKPLAASHQNIALEDERIHVAIATVIAFILIAGCVLIVRYLKRMPFREYQRSQALKGRPTVPRPPGEGPGFGFDGLSQAQWVDVRDRDESRDASTPGSGMPEMPPAVYLKEDLPLSPIDEKLRSPDVKYRP
ncbi:hypothetical protein EVG20_g1194 [Dentipellis fragilis]|uniref:Uncharacterized protein n=1 Tax=Dentipellis fragilis TaxID=205917 RepID=A0A4Y9ZDB4_9AGAM|nr:hypothetical protein EVG20_g1194 [Dentipellis fragilis]